MPAHLLSGRYHQGLEVKEANKPPAPTPTPAAISERTPEA